MIPGPFSYHRPATLAEAVNLLSTLGDEAETFRWLQGDNVNGIIDGLKGKEHDLHRVESLFPTRFAESWSKFKKDVPDLAPGAAVYLLPAPRRAVGGSVRPLSHRSAVIFGAEEILSVIDSQTAFNVLTQHELTHLYHMQVNPEMRQMIAQVYMPPFAEGRSKLYQVLWLEGLAVYRSKVLNPSSTDQQILLSSTVASDVAAVWPNLGHGLRSVLDSNKAADIGAYLFDADTTGQIPRRAGYYVGMQIARHLSKTNSFAALCRLQGPELRAKVSEALAYLEANGITS